MKHLNKLLTALLLLCCGIATAEDFEVDGVYYNITDETNKTVAVTYRGEYYDSYSNEYTGNEVIPESVTCNNVTYSVTSIGEGAFFYCSGLESITIPNSVTSIGNSAFSGCSGLTSITIPNSVTSIGDWAFSRCSGLTSITIPNSVTSIGYDAFYGTAWYNNQPNGLLYLDGWLLGYKGGAPTGSIVIADGTKGIGNQAFSGSSGLTSITIPNSVTSIGNYAFNGCSGLTSIIVESGNSKYDSRENCNAIIEAESNTLIAGCKNTIIPNSVTSIGGSAFYGCSGLESITIPNSVTTIGNSAFSSCSGLTSITIGNSVTSIGNYAFDGCSGLESITIPNSVTSIGNSAFDGCSGLESITIPNSVTSIGWGAFIGCSGLTSITIPNSVTSIGSDAFSGCSGLTSITIGNSVTSIGWRAFEGCSGLTSITIPNSVTSIGDRAFYGCSGLKTVINYSTLPISEGSNNHGYVALNANIVLNPVKSIDNISATKIYLICQPYHSHGITSWAVADDGNALKSNADLSLSLAKDNQALQFAILNEDGNNYLYHVAKSRFVSKDGSLSNKPIDAVHIQAGAYDNTFLFKFDDTHYINVGGSRQMVINSWSTADGGNSCMLSPVAELDQQLDIVGDFLFSTSGDEHKLFKYLGSAAEVVLPESYNGKNYAIGTKAFNGNTTITSITIPNSVTSIGDEAFEGCSGLTSITIPNSVTSIGERAFYGCRKAETLYISNSVENIGNEAFYGCDGLLEIKSASKIALICSTNIFSENTYNNAYLYVPEGRKFAYEKAQPWNKFYILEFNFTGIDEVVSESKDDREKSKTIYDLNGRKVENPANGIYIIGGKKVLVK